MLTDTTHHLLAHTGWDETSMNRNGSITNMLHPTGLPWLSATTFLSGRNDSHIVRPVIIQYENIYKHRKSLAGLAMELILPTCRFWRQTAFHLCRS